MNPLPPSVRDPMIRAYLGLPTPNVSDALDRLGINGAPLGILPLWPSCPKLVGRAMPMKLVPEDEGSASPVLGVGGLNFEAPPALDTTFSVHVEFRT